ncbi:hypothetical protein MCOR07_007845 [Pyricularia oryzae]|nr:hypothetical protein MCOR01_010656 [Pyricularia oryzae]KAI6266065.1 hypothetical protein MCOR26_010393 [Pyricularia oryzae]KAI6301521.1 hypothetical protein MCOR29_010854 [Pyricularia oryzae]KAI6312801.1 hypothetical protein MCOR30_010478 [Pyricularia oryzae]KAI6370074.1 hypothetical protein MCOR32_006484 [Pyricularia oryzae]
MAYHGCNCILTVVSFGLYTSDVACLRYSKHAITFVGKRPGRPTAQQGQRPEDPTFKACFDGPAEASKGRLNDGLLPDFESTTPEDQDSQS